MLDGLPADKKTPIVMICAIGKRSLAAVQILKGRGYENVKNIRGGLQAWMSEGQPLQVR
jgi:rhodanese-related sulfurtransferase